MVSFIVSSNNRVFTVAGPPECLRIRRDLHLGQCLGSHVHRMLKVAQFLSEYSRTLHSGSIESLA